MNKLIPIIAIAFLLCNCRQPRSTVYRGFNLSVYSPDTGEITLQDFQIIQNVGATLVRLDFSKCPLMSKTAPFSFNEDNFIRMHNCISWAEQTDLKIVIDPHTFPGTALPWTILSDDNFWFDKKYYQLVIHLWDRIARECCNYGDVIWGYDLLNEPYGRNHKDGQTWDLNELYKDVIKTIRAVGDTHSIILMFNDTDFADYAQPPQGYGESPDKIIYSTHFYQPFSYTHQGVNFGRNPVGSGYPNIFKRWNRISIERQLRKYSKFQKNGSQIFIGEFSCNYDNNACWDKNEPLRIHPKNGGDRWMKHVVNAFEKYGYHWTYHCYKDWQGWDATTPYPRWVLVQQLLGAKTLHPGAHINFPQDNQIFQPGTPIEISASGWDKDGEITCVEFFADSQKLGEATAKSFCFTWKDALPGSYRIGVRAIDNSGAAVFARPVDIAVQPNLPECWKNADYHGTAAPGCAFFIKDDLYIHAAEDDLYTPGIGFHAVLCPAGKFISAKFTAQSGKQAKDCCGMFVKLNDKHIYQFYFTGKNQLIVQHNDKIIKESKNALPCYLKLNSESGVLQFYVSQYGKSWQPVTTCATKLYKQAEWGFFAAAEKDVFVNKVKISDIDLK